LQQVAILGLVNVAADERLVVSRALDAGEVVLEHHATWIAVLISVYLFSASARQPVSSV
jgi:hypothetical protein